MESKSFEIEWIDEYADNINTEILFIGGSTEERKRFAPSIIGIATRFGMNPVVAYNYNKVIEIISEDMSEEEAIEYFEYNVIGAWLGEGTPVFIEVIEKESGLSI